LSSCRSSTGSWRSSVAVAGAGGFLEGVNVAALGLIAAVALQLGRAALVDPITISIALVSFVVLLRAPLAAPPLVIAGGVVGVLLLR